MLDHFVTAQIVGIVAVTVSLLLFQFNDRRKMLNIGVCSALLWTLHFYLLGAYTGSAMNGISAIRDLTLARTKPTSNNLWILGAIMLLATAATIITWHGIVCILPLIACGLNAASFWSTNTKRIRRFYLLVPPLWFTYNFFSHSYPGMAIELILVISNIVAQFRFDRKKTSRRKLATKLQTS